MSLGKGVPTNPFMAAILTTVRFLHATVPEVGVGRDVEDGAAPWRLHDVAR